MCARSSQPIRKLKKHSANKTLHALRWAFGTLPRWFVRPVTEGLFSIASRCTKNLNKICIQNLKAVYGASKSKEEYEVMSRMCIKNIGRCMIDLLYYVERPDELEKVVSIEGEEHLKEALKGGKGIIAISAHLNNFPLLFVFLVHQGYDINVIIRPMRNKKFSQFMHELCALWRIHMIQTVPRKRFIKETFGALKRNELLFILFDEIPPEEGIEVDFFDRKVSRAVGPMLFHERIGSPILPIFIVQDEKRHFKIMINRPLEIEEKYSEEKNTIMNISTLTAIIEGNVRKYPLQWGGWLNKRWLSE